MNTVSRARLLSTIPKVPEQISQVRPQFAIIPRQPAQILMRIMLSFPRHQEEDTPPHPGVFSLFSFTKIVHSRASRKYCYAILRNKILSARVRACGFLSQNYLPDARQRPEGCLKKKGKNVFAVQGVGARRCVVTARLSIQHCVAIRFGGLFFRQRHVCAISFSEAMNTVFNHKTIILHRFCGILLARKFLLRA